jgi:hypothetical protein
MLAIANCLFSVEGMEIYSKSAVSKNKKQICIGKEAIVV